MLPSPKVLCQRGIAEGVAVFIDREGSFRRERPGAYPCGEEGDRVAKVGSVSSLEVRVTEELARGGDATNQLLGEAIAIHKGKAAAVLGSKCVKV